MITFDGHDKIEYSVVDELINDTVESTLKLSAVVKSADLFLEVGNVFSLFGRNYQLYKASRNKQLTVYYEFKTTGGLI